MNTRDLTAVQTLMLSLDIGLWSGVKRKMELSEGFIYPLITVCALVGVSPHGVELWCS